MTPNLPANQKLGGVVLLLFCAFGLASCVLDEGRVSTDTDMDTEQEPDASPSATPVVDPCRLAAATEVDFIEDFEYGIATQWWVSYDDTKPGFHEPTADDCDRLSRLAEDNCFVTYHPGEVCDATSTKEDSEHFCYVRHWPGREPSATEMPNGRCGISRYALRIVVENLIVYGGALGLNFYRDPHDVSDWEGVSFWAKREEGSGRSLFVSVSDKYTDEVNGKLLFDDEAPYCLESADDETLKCDRFGVGIGLDASWRFFKIPFGDMKQRGYGQAAPELDVTGILGLNFGFEAGSWDFWIDDVAFYRER